MRLVPSLLSVSVCWAWAVSINRGNESAVSTEEVKRTYSTMGQTKTESSFKTPFHSTIDSFEKEKKPGQEEGMMMMEENSNRHSYLVILAIMVVFAAVPLVFMLLYATGLLTSRKDGRKKLNAGQKADELCTSDTFYGIPSIVTYVKEPGTVEPCCPDDSQVYSYSSPPLPVVVPTKNSSKLDQSSPNAMVADVKKQQADRPIAKQAKSNASKTTNENEYDKKNYDRCYF